MDCPGKYFNSRPHGGRPCAHCIIHFINCISTHALTEGDRIGQAVHNTVNISTHALTEGDRAADLEESDSCGISNSRPHGGRPTCSSYVYDSEDHFNSRPHGGRLHFSSSGCPSLSFQLTPSRRATAQRVCIIVCVELISTHALTEGDHTDTDTAHKDDYFNSRPHGGRL